jgi:ferredoxin-NADP reductase
MSLPSYSARCTAHRKIAEEIFEFTLEKPRGFTFQAGQFILFEVPLVGQPTDIQPRAFSIASAPEEEVLLFVAKIKQGGRAGRWISEELSVGSTVRFAGPCGNFLLDEQTTKGYLFLCTCSGIAPFRSHISHALASGDRRPMDVLFGVRDEAHLFWQEEFRAWERAYSNFHLHVTLSQPSPAWSGLTGRVQAVLPRVITDIPERSIYLCGHLEMIEEAKDLCMQLGAEKQNLHTEGYF